jgi:UPF0271 protein
MQMSLLLNCDLGENSSLENSNVDAVVMPFIDQANIACGYHAGSPRIMRQTINYALQHNVTIGAHPSYPDRENFGRISMNIPNKELINLVKAQIETLVDIGKKVGANVSYVKPHGALYNDMMANGHIRSAIMQAISEYSHELKFMLQATPQSDMHKEEALIFGLDLIFEVFADRCYTDDGALLNRKLSGAVHNREKMLSQVAQLKNERSITTVSGQILFLEADSICVHGDNAEGVAAIKQIRELIQ